jgi:hypothetical protein
MWEVDLLVTVHLRSLVTPHLPGYRHLYLPLRLLLPRTKGATVVAVEEVEVTVTMMVVMTMATRVTVAYLVCLLHVAHPRQVNTCTPLLLTPTQPNRRK